MKNRKSMIRLFSMLLCVLMIFSLLPMTAFASWDHPGDHGGDDHGPHIDVRVAGELTFITKVNGKTIKENTVNVTVSNVTGTLNNNPLSFTRKTGDGDENEWRHKLGDTEKKPATDKIVINCTLTGTVNNVSFTKNVTMNYSGETTLQGFINKCPDNTGYDIDILANQLEESFTVNKTVTKVWNDDNNREGLRPDSIQVQLLSNDAAYGDPVTLNEANGWKATFENLPDNATYTVQEVNVPAGYTSSVDGLTITNTYTPATTSVSGQKTWEDNDNRDGLRPDEITVNLLANNVKVDSKTVTANDSWSYSFTDLPVYENGGKEITYTVTEDPVDGYTATYSGYNITNSHTPDIITISGVKTWDDDNNRDGKRPESITVYLYANGANIDTKIVSAETSWAYSFENLPKFKNGKEIIYTITEASVEGYTTEIDGYNITNTHAPATTSVSGQKTWEDNNNQDGLRPDEITVNLLANNVKVDSKTVTAETSWAYSFTDLPKFENGVEIRYSVSEEAVTGYTTTYNGYNITNTHTPATTSVSGTKIWEDGENQDGKRPDEITVYLYANGREKDSTTASAATNWDFSFNDLPVYENGGEKIDYTVREKDVDGYISTISGTSEKGYTITNTHTPATTSVSGIKTWDDGNNQDGLRPDEITVNLLANGKLKTSTTVSAETNWKFSFTDLPVYENGGKEIDYTVTEDPVEGYTATYSGYNITNSHTPDIITISGTKTWDDDGDRDGIRPSFIVLTILADGEPYGEVKVTSSTNWKWSMENLPKNKSGKKIVYTIRESEVEGYQPTINGFDLTNTHEIETVTVSGTKTWNDDDNRDGIRPEKITVNLLANGDKIKTMEVSAETNWGYSFENLPKFENGGEEIVYTIEELEVEGYSTETDGYDLINTHEIETTNLTVSKIWEDDDNRDGIRPGYITITVMNGEKEVVTARITAENNWTWTSESLPKNENGKPIEYTVIETAEEGYEASYDGLTITNTHEIETVTVSGTKTWDDDDNRDGIRPGSITVNLLANGDKIKTMEVSAETNWGYSFENLPKFENGGDEIVYTIEELEVDGYTTETDGYDLINTHDIATVDLTVTKVWDDKDDQDSLRPKKVTVYILANGNRSGNFLMLSAENQWTATIEGLPEFENGEKIVYTLEEQPVEGYTPKVTGTIEEGFTLTNTHTPAEPTVPETTVPETTVPETTVPATTTPTKTTDVPKTGDNSNLFLWSALLLASIIGMTALVITKKNRA